GGEERRLGPRSLDKGVDAERRAMIDEIRGVRLEPHLVEAVENPGDEILVGGGSLGIGDAAPVMVIRHQIGESAADIDGNGIGHRGILQIAAGSSTPDYGRSRQRGRNTYPIFRTVSIMAQLLPSECRP